MTRVTTKPGRLIGLAAGAIAAIAAVAVHPRDALAHRDDFLNETEVYLTLERGELEFEYWFDAGRLSSGAPDEADFTRHSLAAELGVARRWTADARATVIAPEGERSRFDSWRLETRYRFKDEGVWPVDVAASIELSAEREHEGPRDVALEPCLILSRDLTRSWNVVVNLGAEVPVEESEPTAGLAALGTRFDWSAIRVGSEVQYDFRRHAGWAIPQISFVFTPELILNLGYAARLNREIESFARAALEVDF